MKIAIRADASLKIGSGHIMRCLTLADSLREQGAEVRFLCRPHNGNLIGWIKQKGYHVDVLEASTDDSDKTLFHSAWLGATQIQDAEQCTAALNDPIDWLIVDHYALDKTWQALMQSCYQKLMVIDDLGDRENLCDVLLDQNFGSTEEKYRDLVPKHCQVLAGSDYTLLRPEFVQWREYSLQRRKKPDLKKLLINLGGVDAENLTTQLLEQLQSCDLPYDIEITAVMGATAPHLKSVERAAQKNKFQVSVKTGVSNMAELMANADLAIGAAGSTSWERCCLGLPTIQLVIAENQKVIAQALSQVGAVILLEQMTDLAEAFNKACAQLKQLSENSAKIADGQGTGRVCGYLSKVYFSESGATLIPYCVLSPEQSRFVLQMRNHETIRQWMTHQNVISETDHFEFVGSLINRKDRQFFLAKNGDEVIGTVNFTEINAEKQNAEFGIFANPFLYEKGRGKWLMNLAIDYAIHVLKLKYLKLVVFADNKVAIGLYQKFGFIETSRSMEQNQRMLSMTKELTKSIHNEN